MIKHNLNKFLLQFFTMKYMKLLMCPSDGTCLLPFLHTWLLLLYFSSCLSCASIHRCKEELLLARDWRVESRANLVKALHCSCPMPAVLIGTGISSSVMDSSESYRVRQNNKMQQNANNSGWHGKENLTCKPHVDKKTEMHWKKNSKFFNPH